MITSPHPLHSTITPFRVKRVIGTSCNLKSSIPKIRTFHQTPYVHGVSIKANREKLRNLIELCRFREAMEMYGQMRSTGHELGVVIESMLVDLLMKSGEVEHAFKVFDEMPERNIISWTSVISGFVRIGKYNSGLELFHEMIASGIEPNDFALNVAIKACTGAGSVEGGKQVHSLIVRLGLLVDTWTGNSLIDFYAKCGSMKEALMVFDRMPERNMVSYTALISGYCFHGLPESAVHVFYEMVCNEVRPNEHTLSCVLTACGRYLGKQIHCFMVKNGLHESVFSVTALIDFYSRNHEHEMAEKIFQNLKEKNVVTWCSIIASCIRSNRFEDALKYFNLMIMESIKPNEYVLSTALGACKSANFGKQLHSLAIKHDFASDIRVTNALISMYARIGHVEDLESVFVRSESPDLVTWSAVVSGYFQNGFEERSIMALCYMHQMGYTPNDYALSSGLSSCAGLTLLDQGRQFHGLAVKLGLDLGICGGNALINMYSKCGCVNGAEIAFDTMYGHDATSWNSLIHGYAYNGRAKEVIELFNEMEIQGILPDDSTFLGLLFACNHGGLLEKAQQYFTLMKTRYNITPSSQHYACIIDMLGRNGRLEEALSMILEMEYKPDILIWKTLLGSCRLHGNLEIGKIASNNVKELSMMDSASYVLMSNLYAMHGEWDEAGRERRGLDELGLKKKAGWSTIEIKNKVHCFFAGDRMHRDVESVYKVLEELSRNMKDEGNVSVCLECNFDHL